MALAASFGMSAAHAVEIDQAPLASQINVPPNIMFLLDDSGVMGLDYLPQNAAESGDLRDATNNRLYYDPGHPYDPPPGYSRLADPRNAPLDGLESGSDTTDILSYTGTFEYSESIVGSSQTHQAFIYHVAGVDHYVVPTSGGCGQVNDKHPNAECHLVDDDLVIDDQPVIVDGETVTIGENITNWFAYYRTRSLMARSGIFRAMSGLSSDNFRLGWTTSNSGTVTGVDSFADAEPTFREWLAGVGEDAEASPLPSALKSVGDYYSTADPWGEFACRSSYTIVVTSGYWDADDSTGVGNADGESGPSHSNDKGQRYSYPATPPFADEYSDSLADVAMAYWKNDLQGNLVDHVAPNGSDPAFWQHMVTLGAGIGLTPQHADGTLIDPDVMFDWARGGDPIDGFAWPDPADQVAGGGADLLHAAVNGHGEFYSTDRPQDFAGVVEAALGRAQARAGTNASLAASSTQITEETFTYQAIYDTENWSGDLKAYRIDPATKQIEPYPTWEAASLLAARDPANRDLVTFDGNGEVALSWSSLSAPQQQALEGSEAVLNYLRGDDGDLRPRATPLGDIVHSGPVYVGRPVGNLYAGMTFTGADEYFGFATYPQENTVNPDQTGIADVPPAIYVASNDGMLHGFDAASGEETIAYLPGSVITGGLNVETGTIPAEGDTGYGDLIARIADNVYDATTHRFFNDGQITVASAYLSGEWRRILVGTTGRGPARAVYALDVTYPDQVSLLWERYAGDQRTGSEYIGQMIGKPVVAQTADGEWSALLGNGLNSPNGLAALLQFNLETGALRVHETDGVVDNGLAAPAWFDISMPADGIQDVAYAGDLAGRVWRFDLQGELAPTGDAVTGATSEQAFQTDTGQPITAGMRAAVDPATGNRWIFFGTGRYLASEDRGTTAQQTWYGLKVWDNEADTPELNLDDLAGGKGALAQRQVVAQFDPSGDVPGQRFFTLEEDLADPAVDPLEVAEDGWYIDLPDLGERMYEPNQYRGGLLTGLSLVPETDDTCSLSGASWLMTINAFTGTNVDQPFIDINGDGVVDEQDAIELDGKTYAGGSVGFTTLANDPIMVGNSMFISFEDGSVGSFQTSGGIGMGLDEPVRSSWRELVVD
ncbi:pilus assembly protein [Guyparkeria sp.]|uniref:pilus assembly protein n=1 Tax=Guyparkeria sp. TaxID=2035736 RepID=UPI0039706518